MLTEVVAFYYLLLLILTADSLLVPSVFPTTPSKGVPALCVVLCSLNVDLAFISFTKEACSKAGTSLYCLLPFTKRPWEWGRGAER